LNITDPPAGHENEREAIKGLRVISAKRYLGAVAMFSGMALFALAGATPAADSQSNARLNGQVGFVVSHIAYALSKDASETGACPEGMTKGYGDAGGFNDIGAAFVSRPELQHRDGEVEDQYVRRVFKEAMSDPSIKNLCMNPELGKPDPNFRTVTGKNVPAEGIDLDGQDSHINGKAAPNMCPHEDFRGMNGERGIDNQFFRLVGCSKSWQSTGLSNSYEIEMYTGAWGILITLKGAGDLRNAENVEVGIDANADPIQLSPTRQALPNATYAIDQDPRFRATTHGRIVNGVLTTEPVDVRFHVITNGIHLERPLKYARLRMTVTPDGGMDGIMAGYTPVEELYDFQYGFRNGKDAKGNPSPLQLRTVSSIGQAAVLGHTCQGAYYAMKQLADGDRDPKTGQCSSISTQYRIKAIPAFVVDTATQSVNAPLDRAEAPKSDSNYH
jgi:hypothetical protein